MPQFEMDHGQHGVLRALRDAKIPELTDYDYLTSAPYDPLRSDPTIFLNHHPGVSKRLPAITTVNLVPDELLQATSLVEIPATHVLVGDSNRVLEASSPIARIDLLTTRNETHISFMNNDGEYVDISGLSENAALVAACGLAYAVQIKLTNRKNAGHKFSD